MLPNLDGSIRRFIQPLVKPHIFKFLGCWIYSPATCESFKDRKEIKRLDHLNLHAFNYVRDRQKSDRRNRMRALRKQDRAEQQS